VAALVGDRSVLINGLTDYLYTIPGKIDISREINSYFIENGYNFLQPVEDEEGDEWDDEEW
jgi:hypothetical protein